MDSIEFDLDSNFYISNNPILLQIVRTHTTLFDSNNIYLTLSRLSINVPTGYIHIYK